MSKTSTMPASSHIAALLLLCRVSAWSADRIGSHDNGDNHSSLAHEDNYYYDNRSSRGMLSVREGMDVAVELLD